MLENIKHKIGSFLVNNELKKVNRKIESHNLITAKNVGIVFDYVDHNNLKIIKNFSKYLREEGIKNVSAFCFVNEKETPESLAPFLGFDFVSKKELNWIGIPSGVAYDNFIQNEFDFLIDATSNDLFPTNCVLSLSIAKMKIGKYSAKNENVYDFMIDVHSGDIREYLNQVDKYLKMIKVNI